MVRHARLALLLPALLMAASCIAKQVGGALQAGELSDGSYQARASRFPNAARVEVTVEEGRVVSVELLSHRASGIGHRADSVVPQSIVEQQSTAVDAVSGATNSSHVIMNAAHKALEQAR